MSALPTAITAPLADFLDEEADESALHRAAAAARAARFDLAVLFDWLRAYPASTARRSRAQVVLRAALGMPLVPGPVCRPAP